MHGCSICPQMERLFHQLLEQEKINNLQVLDVADHPDLASQHNIRSVPTYLINGISFNGLKSQQEITQLLNKDESQKWIELIRQELTGGQLDEAERIIRENSSAREAMMSLLEDHKTELVVRIGLTAIIETLAVGSLLEPYEDQFIKMSSHEDERIAVDALYYLSLFISPQSLQQLHEVADSGPESLRDHARDLLEESSIGEVLH